MRHRLLAIVLALLPSGALAAPGWTDVEDITQFGLIPAVAFADGGVEFEAHVEAEGTTNDVTTRLIVTRRAPGGEAVEELRIDSTTTAVPADVAIAVAPNEAAVIAYLERTSNDLDPLPPLRWRAAYRSADGVWEAPVTIASDDIAVTPGTAPDEALHCAIAPDGTAVAGASRIEPNVSEPAPGQLDSRIDLALRPAGGAWQAPQRLTAVNVSSTFGALRVDDEGNFSMFWSSRYAEGAAGDVGDDRNTILLRRLLAGETAWTVAEDVSETGPSDSANAGPHGIAVAPDGRAVVAFQVRDDIETWAATRTSRTGSFGSPVRLVAEDSQPVAAGMAPNGHAYVLYERTGDVQHVGLIKRSDGAWGDGQQVSPVDFNSREGRIGFVGTDAHALYVGADVDARPLVETVRWAADAGLPDSSLELDERATIIRVESVQSDRAGSLVATWFTEDARRRAVFDAGPPALVSRTIPEAAIIVGTSATFAAGFLDVWSPLAGEPTWSFGDGTPDATGSSITRAYAAPGLYTASATSSDVFGNTSTTTFGVTVAACESLQGVDGVACRCGSGLALGVAECPGVAIPDAVARKFTAACQAVGAAQGASSPKKARKAAGKAAKSFKKAAKVLAGKKGKALDAACRDELARLLGLAKDRATAFKGTL